jgi:hypothetical protein
MGDFIEGYIQRLALLYGLPTTDSYKIKKAT